MKNRHMEMIVRKVAEDPNDMRKKPSTVEECDICGKILKYPSRIEAHRRMHSQVKLFQCPHCVKQFAQKSSLNVHMRKHTGERTYLCTWECGKSFYSSSALRLHEKSHSGERKHSCSVCGQLFSKRVRILNIVYIPPPEKKTSHNQPELIYCILIKEQAVVDEVVESVHIERCNKLYNKQQQRILSSDLLIQSIMAGMLRWNATKARQPLRFQGSVSPVAGTPIECRSRRSSRSRASSSMNNGVYGAVDVNTPPSTPTATVIKNVRALRSASDYEVLKGDGIMPSKVSSVTLKECAEMDSGGSPLSPAKSAASLALSKAASS
ncbi:hypothetical protein PFISCL1PPCAC_19322, partial [Pristionchus fissidentatus]